MSKFYTTSEVAKMCQVSPGSVIRWIREGKLKTSRTVGGHRRIQENDLSVLLKELKMPLQSEMKDSAGGTSLAKVLIVDDEQAICTLLREFFRDEFPDTLVEEAWDGFSAGWLARSLCPRIILLDLMLPDIDGFRVCQLIRSVDLLQHTKIIAMTGYGENGKEEILKLGADDFIKKPVDFKRLKTLVSGILELDRQSGPC